MPKINNITTWPYNGYKDFVELRNRLSGRGQKDVFRLGASDIATVLNLNEWADPVTFFYQSCEFSTPPEFRSLDAIRGQNLEPVIYHDYWRHLDPSSPDEESYITNFLGDKKVYRTATKANHIYTNQKYPWLFVSPDYEIDGEDGLVECKSYKGYVLDRYEAGIPRAAVVQCQTQLMATEKTFVELMTLIDATLPRLFRFDINVVMQDWIDINCREFVDKVLEGKKIVYSDLSEEEKETALLLLSPDDQGSPTYSQFLKLHHRPENALNTIDGSQSQLDFVAELLRLKKSAAINEHDILKIENKIREWFMGEKKVGKVDFGEIGHVSYKKNLVFSRNILKKLENAGAV